MSGHDRLLQAYLKWRAPLLRFLQRRLGSAPDAEDMAQEVFVHYAALDGAAPQHERPYLYQIAQNLLRDGARRQAASPVSTVLSLEDPEVERQSQRDSIHPEHIQEHRQRIMRLEEALAELPEKQREAFVLHRFQGLTQDEVAENMGISRRMVVKHLSRAFAYCEMRVQGMPAGQAKAGRASE